MIKSWSLLEKDPSIVGGTAQMFPWSGRISYCLAWCLMLPWPCGVHTMCCLINADVALALLILCVSRLLNSLGANLHTGTYTCKASWQCPEIPSHFDAKKNGWKMCTKLFYTCKNMQGFNNGFCPFACDTSTHVLRLSHKLLAGQHRPGSVVCVLLYSIA